MITVENEAEEPIVTPTLGPILLCAATRWEAEPLAKGLRLRAQGAGRWEGLLGERRVRLIQTGVGALKAGEALDELAGESFGLALSVGFAGALQPGIDAGDIVCDIRGSDAGLPPAARRVAQAQGVGIHFGKIAHADRVLADAGEKRALGAAQRASAVDMETKALREWADQRALPVLPVRVVLDAVDDRLPREVPKGEDFLSLAAYVLKNLPELGVMIATGLKQRRAIANLDRFLKEFLPLV